MGHHNHVENAGFLSLLAVWIDSFQMLNILVSKGLSGIKNGQTKPSNVASQLVFTFCCN